MQAQEKKLDDINDGIYYSIFYKFIFLLNLVHVCTYIVKHFIQKNHMHLSGLSHLHFCKISNKMKKMTKKVFCLMSDLCPTEDDNDEEEKFILKHALLDNNPLLKP